MSQRVVIIGAGHAGLQAAVSLREEGFAGKIVIIDGECDLPYQKPPLSKGFLNNKQTEENLIFRLPHFYETQQIELRLGMEISRIDRANQQVIDQTGETITYDYLILATGARNRPLPVTGAQQERIFYLRTLEDARRIKKAMETCLRVAVIGGGFIGLEFAACARESGKEVTLIETQAKLMNRVIPPVLSEVFQLQHQKMGVEILLNSQVLEIRLDSNGAFSIEMNEGRHCIADMIVVGIGVMPNTELAQAAGLACENGIVVNDILQSSDPHIFAIGDCAQYFNHFAGRKTRLESVQNATDQAKCVAKTIQGAHPCTFEAVPWFWTYQYDLKLQMAGLSEGYDEYHCRGEAGSDKFSLFYYRAGQLIAVDSLNRPADHLAARKLLQAGISPGKEQVKNEAFKLNDLLKTE